MRIINLKIFLLLIFLTQAMFSFCQIENTYFILDTADARYYNTRYHEYYNDTIIKSKLFYYGDESKLHYEFIRVGINKYYCIEYKADGKKISEGIVIKENNAFDSAAIPIYDSVGNIVSTKYLRSFKFIKDEFWYENIDSFSNYQYGKYRNNMRDSIWRKIRDWNIETELWYSNGKFIKEEKVNLAGTGDSKIKAVLERKWDLITLSYTTPLKFVPGKPTATGIDFLGFNSNGTLEGRLYGGAETNSFIVGKWELIDNYKKIKFTIKGTESIANIIYISKYGLTLTFDQR